MKIDLKKLSELELEYGESPIAKNTLQTLVDTVLYDDKTNVPSAAKTLAMTTLQELGVLKPDHKTAGGVLNS